MWHQNRGALYKANPDSKNRSCIAATQVMWSPLYAKGNMLPLFWKKELTECSLKWYSAPIYKTGVMCIAQYGVTIFPPITAVIQNENLKSHYLCQVLSVIGFLTHIMLMWRIWWAPNNASKWQMGFNSAFKYLTSKNVHLTEIFWHIVEC